MLRYPMLRTTLLHFQRCVLSTHQRRGLLSLLGFTLLFTLALLSTPRLATAQSIEEQLPEPPKLPEAPSLPSRSRSGRRASRQRALLNPRSLAMGEAVRAAAISHSALLFNPAGMGTSGLYSLEGYYARGESRENLLGLNIVDSQLGQMGAQPHKVSGGLAYQQGVGGEGGWETRIGIARPLFENQGATLHLGIAGRYWVDEVVDADGFTLDLGALLVIGDMIRIAFVGEDLLEEGGVLTYGGGVALMGNGPFALGFDYIRDAEDNFQEYAVGGELILAPLILRGGYRDRSFEAEELDPLRWASGGIGFVSQGGGAGEINLAYRHGLNDGAEQLFIFGLRLQIDAYGRGMPSAP